MTLRNKRFRPWVRKTPNTPTTKSTLYSMICLMYCLIKIRCMRWYFFILTSLNGDKWLDSFPNQLRQAHHHYKPEELKQKRLKNLTGIVFPNNDHNRSVNQGWKRQEGENSWNHLGKKAKGIKLPDIKATMEVLSRLEPQRFLKTKAENPKQMLKKKLIR